MTTAVRCGSSTTGGQGSGPVGCVVESVRRALDAQAVAIALVSGTAGPMVVTRVAAGSPALDDALRRAGADPARGWAPSAGVAPSPAEAVGGGRGVGLPLVRQLVVLHGGTVTAASDGSGQPAHRPAAARGRRQPACGVLAVLRLRRRDHLRLVSAGALPLPGDFR